MSKMGKKSSYLKRRTGGDDEFCAGEFETDAGAGNNGNTDNTDNTDNTEHIEEIILI